MIAGSPSIRSFSPRLTATLSGVTIPVRVFGLTVATPLPAAACVRISGFPAAIRAVRAAAPASVTIDLNLAMWFSSLCGRRVDVPVHSDHDGTGRRLGRFVLLGNIRRQSKDQVRGDHLAQCGDQRVAL